MLQVTDQVVRHVRVAGQDVACSVVGNGPPLVVGGWWCSHLTLNWEDPAFRGYVSRLAEHHQVVRYDRPGSGASSPEGEAPPDLDAEIDVLAALLAALDLDRVDLVGASSGAAVVAGLAARRPAQVGRVVLYGAFARGADLAPEPARTAMLDAVADHWGLGSRLLDDVFVPGATAAEREEFAAFQRQSATRIQARDALAATYRIDASAHLAALARPTTVLHRRHDRAVPLGLGVDVAGRVRAATFVALSGEDHFPWRGDGAAVADATLHGLGHRVPRRHTERPTRASSSQAV
jgi:pimeloyl-ACP methyl ester carboxylesterase